MIYWISVIMSFSVIIAAVIAAFRYQRLNPDFHPFIWCTWIASLNEITSFLLSYNGYSNIANNNIYILCEGMLILWQFKRWNLFTTGNQVPFLLTILLAGTWIYEIHSLQTLQQLHYYYRLFCAIMVVICSINMNNRLIISHNKRLIANPVFYICTGYILFFTMKIVTDTYWLYNPKSSAEFLTTVFYSIAFNNLVINLLFIIAILWIPKRPNYITF